MSEIQKLRAKHALEIEVLQSNCSHPMIQTLDTKMEEGVWGVGVYCRRCGKRLAWDEEPRRTHEVEYISVEDIR